MALRKALWLSKEPPTEAMETLVANRFNYELLHDEQIAGLVEDMETLPNGFTEFVKGLHGVAVSHDAMGVVFMSVPAPIIAAMTDMAYLDATTEVHIPLLRCFAWWKEGVIPVGVIRRLTPRER